MRALTRSWRRSVAAIGTTLLTFSVMAAIPAAQAAPAPCPAGWSPQLVANFEIDGNLCVNSDGNLDWANVGGQPVENDGYNDSTQFTGGAKENNWPWTTSQVAGSGTAPDKTDIGNVYAFTETYRDDVYAFFGFERAKNSGSVAYHVELNQKANQFGPVPNRAVGDLRLTINQTGSNTISLVGADTWTGSAWASLNSLVGFIGQVNQGAVTNLSGATLDTGTFAEVAVDLTTLFGSAGCSGNYGVLNVRSSSSPEDTSSLADWIEPVSLKVPSTCASVQVNKNWVIDGTSYANGAQPFGAASPTLTGQSSPAFGTAYATQNTGPNSGKPYVVGNSVTVGESAVTGLPAGCTNVSSGGGTFSLNAGLNTYTITNTVTCTYLTLIKSVQGGAALPAAWTLTAGGPTAVSGASGSPAVTTVHVAPGTYSLGESGGPAGYTQTSLRCSPQAASNGQVVIAAGNNVTCTFTNTADASVRVNKTWVIDGTTYPDGSQPNVYHAAPTVTGGSGTAPTAFGGTGTGYLYGDTVTVGETAPTLPTGCSNVSSGDLGARTLAAGLNTFAITNTVSCTYLTLVKDVNGTAPASSWTLSATGPTTISGATGTGAVTKVHVLPGTYTLGESGPAGYKQTGLVCTSGGSGNTVVLRSGEDVTCTFTNTAFATVTLRKQWVNGSAGDTASLSVTGGTSALSTAAGGNQTDTTHTVTVTVLEGQTVSLGETVGADNTGSYTASLACTQPGLSYTPGQLSGTYTMPLAAADVTCTLTNTRTSATLVLNKVWQNGHIGDTATLSAATPGGVTTAPAPSTVVTGAASEPDTTASHEATVTVYSGESVDLSETLGAANAGTYTSASACSAGSLSTTSGIATTLTVPKDLSAISTINCSLTNSRTSATLILRKEWKNGAQGDRAILSMAGTNPTVSGSATSTSDGSADQTDIAHAISETVYTGQPITVSESLPAGNIGTYTSALSCTDASGLTYLAGARTGTYTLPSGVSGPVTCTYVNTRTAATLTLGKYWLVGAAGDSTTLSIDGANAVTATVPAGGTGAAPQTTTVTVYSGQTVTLAESPTATNTGSYTASLSCGPNDGLTYTAGALTGSYTVPSAPTDLTCTFTNTRRSAIVTLVKEWVGAAAGDQAGLTISGPETLSNESATSTATGVADQTDSANSATAVLYSGETVSLNEALPPTGHTNVGSYTSSITCTPGTDFVAAAGGEGGTLTAPAIPVDVTCTVVNTRTTAMLTLQKSWTNGASGDTTALSIDGASSGTGYAVATVPAGGTGLSTDKAMLTIASGAQVSLAEVLGKDTGSYDSSISCDRAGLSPNASGTGGTFTVPATPVNVVCTITNTRTSAHLVVQKTWVNGHTGDSTTLSVTGSDAATAVGATSTSGGQSGSWTDSGHTVTATVYSGEAVTVSEVLGANTGSYTAGLACGNGVTSTTNTGSAGTFVVPAALAGQTITCTVTNTRTSAHLTLRKAWVNGLKDDTTSLVITGSGLSGGGSATSIASGASGSVVDTAPADMVTVTAFSGDSLTLSEKLGAANHGSYTSSIACDPATGFTAADGSYLVPADPAATTCTVTNTRTSGTLTLQKAWVNGYAGDSTALSINGTGLSGTAANTSIAAGVAGTVTDTTHAATVTVYSGDTLTLDESLANGNHGAYTTSISCDSPAGFTANASGDGGDYVVPATPGSVICTVTNNRVTESLVLQKKWVGAVAANSADLTVSGSGLTGAEIGDTGTATATVPANGFTGTSAQTVVATIYSGDTISLGESIGGPNPAYRSALACAGATPQAASDGTSGTLVAPATGAPVTCWFTNTADPAAWTLAKSSVPASGSVVAPGSTISYTLTATHTSGVSATDVTVTDDLSQVLDHAAMGTVAVSTGTAKITGTTLTWTIPELDTTATATYSVTVAEAASDVELSNVAVPGTGGSCPDACSTQHEVPQISKAFVAAQQHMVDGAWDGTWDVTYTVSVVNPSATHALTYSLGDTPAFPADVSVNGATVSSAATDAGTVITGLSNTWTAPTLAIVTGRTIPADTTDVYTVVVNASVPVDEAASECTGEPGHGFDNGATAVFGQTTFSASSCGDIDPLPVPTVAKTVIGAPVQNADGTWTIRYDLAVTNPSATLASVYDLSDALHLGSGITVDDAGVTGPAGVVVNPLWNGVGDTFVVGGRFISPAAVEHYTVTVTATVTTAATATDRDCTLAAGEAGTGFLNGATISTGTSSATSTACAAPVSPTITKKVVSVVPTTPDNWIVTYQITVADPSATTGLVYTLSDTLGFPAQIAVTSTSVTGSDDTGATIPTRADWNGGSQAVIVTGQLLPAGGVDTFTAVIGTSVPSTIPTDVLACTPAGAGHGYFNTGVARSGADSFTATACSDAVATELLAQTIERTPPATVPLASTGAGPLGAELRWGIALLGLGVLLLLLAGRRRSRREP